eukprot:7328382-Alexandrium_andersonii.AAC.3
MGRADLRSGCAPVCTLAAASVHTLVLRPPPAMPRLTHGVRRARSGCTFHLRIAANLCSCTGGRPSRVR